MKTVAVVHLAGPPPLSPPQPCLCRALSLCPQMKWGLGGGLAQVGLALSGAPAHIAVLGTQLSPFWARAWRGRLWRASDTPPRTVLPLGGASPVDGSGPSLRGDENVLELVLVTTLKTTELYALKG